MCAIALAMLLATAPPTPTDDPSSAVVEGVVVDEAGSPVSGVQVVSHNWLQPDSTCTSGADGQFRLVLDSPFCGYRHLYASNLDGSRRGRYLTPFMQFDPIVKVRIVLKPAADVHVIVVDGKDRPVPGAVVVMNDATSSALADATTNEKGECDLRVPADADVTLVAAFKSAVGFDYFENYRAYPPPEPSPVPRQVRLVLDGARTVRVRITDVDGKPMAGVPFGPALLGKKDKIQFAPSMQFLSVARNGSAMPKSDTDGIVTWDWLPLQLQRGVPLDPRMPGYFCPATPYFHMSTGSEPQPCQLLREVKCSGRVMRPDGTPAPGVLVQAEGRGDTNHYCRAYARTRADGTYEMNVYPDQSYLVAIVDSALAAPTRSGILIRSGQPRSDVDFALETGVVVEGRVTAGSKKEPVADDTIYLGQHGPPLPDELGKEVAGRKTNLVRWARTDAEGKYQFRLSRGTYEIAGPDAKFVNLDVSAADTRIVRDFHLPRLPRGPFEIQVRNPDGSPAAGIVVECVHMGDARTDEFGKVRTIRAREPMMLLARDPKTSMGTFAILDAEDSAVVLTLQPATQVAGRVVDQRGVPAANYTITGILISGDDKIWARVSTYSDTRGRFSLPALPTGALCRLQICDSMRCGVKPAREFTMKSPGKLDLGDVQMPKD